MRIGILRGTGLLKFLFFFGFSFTLLSLNFYTNCFRVAEHDWFLSFNHDCEGWVIGRLVKSSQDGIFSGGGLTVRGLTDDNPLHPTDFFSVYKNQEKVKNFLPYFSQIGGQGIFFSFLNKIIPCAPAVKLRLFHGLASLLTALILAAIILWFYSEFGLFTGLTVLFFAVTSQWLTVFGRNLWWSTWAFYLPMATVMYYFFFNRGSKHATCFKLALLVFFAIFIKTIFNGYEYITTTLIMMTVPLVYYSLLNRWTAAAFCKCLVQMAAGAGIAILVSLCILSFQIASVSGSFSEGFNHIKLSLQKRTYADPEQFSPVYQESLQATGLPVVLKYLQGSFFEINLQVGLMKQETNIKISYTALLLFFMLMSLVLYRFSNKCVDRSLFALLISCWVSLSAPLSWFVFFKAHSYIHGHLNFIVWQMPLTFFGAAITGLALKSIFSKKPGNNILTE